nr:MAG: hypothetical protein [clictilig virus 3]
MPVISPREIWLWHVLQNRVEYGSSNVETLVGGDLLWAAWTTSHANEADQSATDVTLTMDLFRRADLPVRTEVTPRKWPEQTEAYHIVH